MRRRLLTALLATVATATPALAEETSTPEAAPAIGGQTAVPDVLAVEVENGAGGLDAGKLREQIAREAAVRVTSDATANGPRLVIRGRGPSTLSFELIEGERTVERTIELPEGSEPKRLATAALVAASLLENDAAELLARLRAEARKTTAAEPPKPAETAPPKPAETARPPCAPRSPELLRWFGADVAPHTGTSSYEPPGTVRRISLELFGGTLSGVRGIEVSPFVSINDGFVCGLQFAGLASFNGGPVRGAQLSGLGGFSTGYVRGAQISGIVGWADRVRGVQAGLILSLTKHELRGAQIGTVAIAEEVHGLQVGLVHVARDLSGAQLGLVNIVRDVSGTQLGLVNVARDVSGAQFGIVNVARKTDASIGIVSVVKEGRTTIHGFGGTDGVLTVAVQHGSRFVHNYYGGAVSLASKEGFTLGPTLGIGFHAYEGPRAFVDIDAIAQLLFSTTVGGDMQTLWQGRAVVGLRLTPGFALYAGPSFDALMVPSGQAPRAFDGGIWTKTVATGGGSRLHLSPGLIFGARGL
jgi:hypothetical protein